MSQRLLGPNGRPIREGAGALVRARAMASDTPLTYRDKLPEVEGLAAPAYESGGRSDPMFADVAYQRSADRAWLPHRNSTVSRVRQLHRNDPVAKSAVRRKRNAAVGKGWRLSSRPDYRTLGITPEAARELGSAIEREWKAYAYGHAFEIDAERTKTLGQLLGMAVSHDMLDGEVLGLVEYAAEEDTRYKTRLRIVHPDRLSNPNGKRDDGMIRGGVERNRAEVPIRYWIRERHPNEMGVSTSRPTWNGFERFTPWGRPQVLHCFDCEEAGQSRGVSRFAASLKSFRALSKFTEATIQAATINALMVAFIKSSAGPDAVSESFSIEDLTNYEGSRETFYANNPVSLDGGPRMPVLPFGDEIDMATDSKDVGQFDAFVRSVIRLIAASLGVTYEELTMDYSQTNYSSARAAMIPAWNETMELVARLEAQLLKPFFVAWLEEAFDSGYLEMPAGAPDFYDAVDAYAESRWIGPARGYIDPTKEIDAAAGALEARIATREQICAERGEHWEDVDEQTAIEEANARRLNLERASPGARDRLRETSRDPVPADRAAA